MMVSSAKFDILNYAEPPLLDWWDTQEIHEVELVTPPGWNGMMFAASCVLTRCNYTGC